MNITSFPLPPKATGWPELSPSEFPDSRSTLFLIFACSGHDFRQALKFICRTYPSSIVVGINGGIIFNEKHTHLRSTVWAISLQHGFFQSHVSASDDSLNAGYELGSSLTDYPTSHGGNDQVRGALLFMGQNLNGESVMNGINALVQGDLPIIGASSSALSPEDPAWISINGDLSATGAVAISIHGDVLVGHGWGSGWVRHPKARPFRVTKAVGTKVLEINGRPAYPFLMETLQATGLSVEEQRQILLRNPLALDDSRGDLTPDRIRVVYDLDPDTNSISFIGTIKPGTSLTWCQASPEKLADGAAQAVSTAMPSTEACAIAFTFTSCGRMALFGPHLERECEALRSRLTKGAYMAGISTHGQVAPLTATTPISAWLNQTVSVLTLSEPR